MSKKTKESGDDDGGLRADKQKQKELLREFKDSDMELLSPEQLAEKMKELEMTVQDLQRESGFGEKIASSIKKGTSHQSRPTTHQAATAAVERFSKKRQAGAAAAGTTVTTKRARPRSDDGGEEPKEEDGDTEEANPTNPLSGSNEDSANPSTKMTPTSHSSSSSASLPRSAHNSEAVGVEDENMTEIETSPRGGDTSTDCIMMRMQACWQRKQELAAEYIKERPDMIKRYKQTVEKAKEARTDLESNFRIGNVLRERLGLLEVEERKQLKELKDRDGSVRRDNEWHFRDGGYDLDATSYLDHQPTRKRCRRRPRSLAADGGLHADKKKQKSLVKEFTDNKTRSPRGLNFGRGVGNSFFHSLGKNPKNHGRTLGRSQNENTNQN